MTTTSTQKHEPAGHSETGGCCGGKKQAALPEKPAGEKPAGDAAASSHGCCKSAD